MKIITFLIAPKLFTVEHICLGLINEWEKETNSKINIIAEDDGYLEELNNRLIYKDLEYSNAIFSWNDIKYIKHIRNETLNDRTSIKIIYAVTLKMIFLTRISTLFINNVLIINCHRGMGRHFSKKINNVFISKVKNLLMLKILKFCCDNENTINWLTNVEDLRILLTNNILNNQNKTILTKNSIDVKKYSSIIRKQRENIFTVVMVSRLIKNKGIDTVLKCAELIAIKKENISILLVGSFENENETKNRVVNACTENKCIDYLEFTKNTISIYESADIAILPSKYNEGGYPRSILEPMASGIPIITSNIQGCNNGIENGINGLLINPGSASELFNAILLLKNDNDLYNRISKNSKKYIFENHSHEDIALKVISKVRKEFKII
tara:strand:+ start:5359 stop:6507 length:1149 start_codon:yes stop_codon:yes gene_type:complete